MPTATSTGTPTRTATATHAATPTRTSTPQPAGIYGRVTYYGGAVSGAQLTLWFWNGTAWSEKAHTATKTDGSYLFGSIPSLGAEQGYEVDYGQNTDDRYLSSWYGPYITVYTSGTPQRGGDFDIANVSLLAPEPGSFQYLPVTFSWQRRGLPGDTYQVGLFDLDTGEATFTSDLGDVGSATINSLPGWVVYGRQYGWIVRVCSGEEGCGDSYYYHAITFTGAAGQSTGISLPVKSMKAEWLERVTAIRGTLSRGPR